MSRYDSKTIRAKFAGKCACCGASIAAGETDAEIADLYGQKGVNWGCGEAED